MIMDSVSCKKMTHVLFAVAALFVTQAVFAAPSIRERTEPRSFTDKQGQTFLYRWAEKAAPEGEKVPLVFFLHGAGERGTNNVAQLVHGVPELVDWLEKNEKGFKLVAGQVPNGRRWVEVDWSAKAHTMPVEPSVSMASLMDLMDRLLEDPTVDPKRVYVTGISMGGYGTWDLACRRPDAFAAAMPICGGADVAQAKTIAALPIWTFHGSKDGAVPVCRSRRMVSALWEVGSDAHYREYPDAGHGIWARTYRDPEVLKWFFSQKRR